MNDREFLKKIRRIQEGEEKISLTNIPVNTENKKQESVINKLLNESRLINENEIQTIEPDEQREEENRFKDIVSKLVKFKPIKVHKENVEWSGHLIRERIDWHFSLDDTTGCYINTSDLIQLRDDTLEVLKKLRGYYDVWSDEWSGRLVGATPTDEEDIDLEGEDFDFGGETDEPSEEGESEFGF